MVLLTIYTATFNRADLLNRVYESLKEQTCKDFLWHIIDDGSTDNTKHIVQQMINATTDFEIQYTYKKNGGVHTARNLAIELCNTELITALDSDDWLLPNAVEDILKIWKANKNENIAGIFCPNIFENGTPVCTGFPKDIKNATFQDFTYKYKCKGDKKTIIRTDILQSLKPAPVFEGEKLVGESYRWIQLPEIPFILYNHPLGVVEYQADGYSGNAHNGMFNNPRGFREYYREHITNAHYLKPRIRGHLGYIVCSLIIKDTKYIKHSPTPIKSLLLTPLGILLHWKMKRNRRGGNSSGK